MQTHVSPPVKGLFVCLFFSTVPQSTIPPSVTETGGNWLFLIKSRLATPAAFHERAKVGSGPNVAFPGALCPVTAVQPGKLGTGSSACSPGRSEAGHAVKVTQPSKVPLPHGRPGSYSNATVQGPAPTQLADQGPAPTALAEPYPETRRAF